MKKIFFLILLVSLFIIALQFTAFSPINLRADNSSDCTQNLSQLNSDQQNQCLSNVQSQIDQWQKQLNDAQGQEKTLKSQLDYIDAQTQITELKITQTNLEIAKLQREIDDLSGKITRISGTVDDLTKVLLNRIVATYKYGDVTTIDLLFSSDGFSDILERLKYIEVAQANDKKTLYDLQATKTTYNNQKQDRLERQAEQDKLKSDLETYQTQLASEKAAKDELLRITQNQEALYESKIRTAQQEQDAILAILNGGGNEVSEGPVHKGDIIAHMIVGPSACSSGTHLHFEVHQNGSLIDPNNFLSNTSFEYIDNDGGNSEGKINPHGSWDWPIYPQIIITQGYGMTPYALAGAYNGGPHTGIDMYSGSGSYSVIAVKDGTLSVGTIACGGGTLHYKKIDQGDGTTSYYLHVL